MANKITFTEMQEFINLVADNVISNGEGWKKPMIDYCTCKYYGKQEFDTDNIAELYDNGKIKCCNVDFNAGQYGYIMKAIDAEIQKKIKYISASLVMTDANDAIANLVNKVTDVIDKIDKATENVSVDDIKNMTAAFSTLGDKITPDNFVSALVDNGLIKQGHYNEDKDKDENNIKVFTKKDGE